MARSDERFLGRWSRLKQKRRRRQPEPGDVPRDEGAEPEPADAEAATGEEETAALELPDIDTLDKDSDYSVFMKEGVPEELKKLALRKLWLSDPDLVVLDGLNDYDEDYRFGEGIATALAKGADEMDEGSSGAGAGPEAKGDKKEAEKAPGKRADVADGPPAESAPNESQSTGDKIRPEVPDAPDDDGEKAG